MTTPALGADKRVTSDLDDRKAIAGVIVKLPGEWSAEADYTWDRTEFTNLSASVGMQAAGTAAIANGSLDILRDTNEFGVNFAQYANPSAVVAPVRTVLKDTTVRVAGPTWALPAGPVWVSSLLETRDEEIGDYAVTSGVIGAIWPSRSQKVNSVYVEARIPVFSGNYDQFTAPALDLQIAGRYDDYETKGSNMIAVENGVPIAQPAYELNSFNAVRPTLGIRFLPLRDVMLRASFAGGFLPPSVSQLVPNEPVPLSDLGLVDPRRGNEPVNELLLLNGGNPDLRPEDSETYSAGFVLTPRLIPRIRFSADWTKIIKTNNIDVVVGVPEQSDIANETLLPSTIVRGPVPTGDPFGVGPIVAVNGMLINVAKAEVDVYDLALDYSFGTDRFGTFDFSMSGTRQNANRVQTAITTPIVDRAGTASSPRWNGNAQVNWTYGQWQVGWTGRYLDSSWLNQQHTVNLNTNTSETKAQVIHDLFASFRMAPQRSSFLSSVEVQLGVKNVFNEKPQSFGTGEFYDFKVDPRLARYWLRLRAEFGH